MTGREIISYILENRFENEQLIEPGCTIKMLDENRTAALLGVGPGCVNAWSKLGVIHGIERGGKLYFITKIKE